MGKIPAKGTDVGNIQHVKLLVSGPASRIHRPKNGEGNAAANEANHGDQLQETEQEICIHRVVLQYVGIGKFVHARDPVEEAGRGIRGTFGLGQNSNVGTRHVHPVMGLAQDNEEEDHDDSNDQGWDQGRDQTGRGGTLETSARFSRIFGQNNIRRVSPADEGHGQHRG